MITVGEWQYSEPSSVVGCLISTKATDNEVGKFKNIAAVMARPNHPAETVGNARLIANAPRLLKAVEYLLSIDYRCDTTDEMDQEVNKIRLLVKELRA